MGILSWLFGKGGQGAQRQGGAWIREVEPVILRVISLGLSAASAHAIRWLFSSLDQVDVFQPIIGWMVAICFAGLGYIVSRGLSHRMMNKESVWLYLPVCLFVEFVEIFANYVLAASVVVHMTWLSAVPDAQRLILTVMTYVMLSIIPMISLSLAVVDMDVERKRTSNQGSSGYGWQGGGSYPVKGASQSSWGGTQQQQPYQGGYGGQNQRQQQGGQYANPMPGVAGVP